ncbi:hypothetical protein Tco_0928330 [Tanacetum coccineum]
MHPLNLPHVQSSGMFLDVQTFSLWAWTFPFLPSPWSCSGLSAFLTFLSVLVLCSWRESSDFYWQSEFARKCQMRRKIWERIDWKNLLLATWSELLCWGWGKGFLRLLRVNHAFFGFSSLGRLGCRVPQMTPNVKVFRSSGGDSGPDMSFDKSTSPEYLLSLARAGLAGVFKLYFFFGCSWGDYTNVGDDEED